MRAYRKVNGHLRAEFNFSPTLLHSLSYKFFKKIYWFILIHSCEINAWLDWSFSRPGSQPVYEKKYSEFKIAENARENHSILFPNNSCQFIDNEWKESVESHHRARIIANRWSSRRNGLTDLKLFLTESFLQGEALILSKLFTVSHTCSCDACTGYNFSRFVFMMGIYRSLNSFVPCSLT